MEAPLLLYQTVDLKFSNTSAVEAQTSLWFGSKTSVEQDSKIYLNCRRCKISEVSINNCPCEFNFLDPLSMMEEGSSPRYAAEDADVRYRAALEISRSGELEITVPPMLSNVTSLPEPVVAGGGVAKEVVHRFSNLISTLDALVYHGNMMDINQTVEESLSDDEGTDMQECNETTDDLEDDIDRIVNGDADCSVLSHDPQYMPMSETNNGDVDKASIADSTTVENCEDKSPPKSTSIPAAKPSTIPNTSNPNSSCTIAKQNILLFVVKISYSLGGDYESNPPFGAFVYPNDSQNTMSPSPRNWSQIRSSQSSSNYQSILDVDGVRTWLPCVDVPYQRPVFDITITTPADCYCICSGVKISETPGLVCKSAIRSVDRISSSTVRRYMTRKLPVCSLGFFISRIGILESYDMPLYQLKGRMFVVNSKGMNGDVPTVEENQNIDSASLCRNIQIDNQANSNDGIVDSPLHSPAPPDHSQYKTSSQFPPFAQESAATLSSFSKLVKHSTLGLDLACKFLHKFTGCSHFSSSYAQVFVPNLGCDSISFDGFSLIDIKFLHSSTQIFMEMPSHIQQVTAYLYSWLKATISLDSYAAEFLFHGSIGYIVNEYVAYVYGEEASNYRFLKMYDTVIQMEMSGRGFPLVTLYPENPDRFSLYFSQYFISKSVVLFHIMEHRCGGAAKSSSASTAKDAMRKSIKQLIKIPVVSIAAAAGGGAVGSMGPPVLPGGFDAPNGSVTPRARSASISSGTGGSTPRFAKDTAVNAIGNVFPPHSPHTSFPSQSPYYAFPPVSPYNSIPPPSPYHSFPPISPYVAPGFPPPSPSNDTPRSLPPSPRDGPPDPNNRAFAHMPSLEDVVVFEECYSASQFLGFIRQHSTGMAANELSDDFLDQYVYDSGIVCIRCGAVVESRPTDAKVKTLSLVLETLGLRNGELLSCSSSMSAASFVKDVVKLRIVESIDDLVSEVLVSVSNKRLETYQHHIQMKPKRAQVYQTAGRRLIEEAAAKEKEAKLAEYGLTEESLRLAKEEEDKAKDSLTVVQLHECPIKMVFLDPGFWRLRHIHFVSSDDIVVPLICVPQSDVLGNAGSGSLDILVQIEGLRFLAQDVHPLSGKSTEFQVKVFLECITGNGRGERDLLDTYVRAEASHSLGLWQQRRAPKFLSADTSSVWEGLHSLIVALYAFVDDVSGLPLPNDFTNEPQMYLRDALLLALSNVQSTSGATPMSVIRTLLLFFENNDNSQTSGKNSTDQGDEEGNNTIADKEKEKATESKVGNIIYDDCHYRATLLLCMSRIKLVASNHDVDNITKVVAAHAVDQILRDYADAWSNYLLGYYPVLTLPAGGIVTAAALQCLGAMDAFRSNTFSIPYSHFFHCHSTNQFTEGWDMLMHIEANADEAKLQKAIKLAKQVELVRNTALEVYVRLCCMRHFAFLKSGGQMRPSRPLPANVWVVNVIRTVCLVLSSEPSLSVRQEAACTLLETLQGNPIRSVAAALSLGEYLTCNGYSDPSGFTLPFSVVVNNKRSSEWCNELRAALHQLPSAGCSDDLDSLTNAARYWWALISGTTLEGNGVSSQSQTVRSTLLSAWIFVFGGAAPANGPVPLFGAKLADPSDVSLADTLFPPHEGFSVLRQDRFKQQMSADVQDKVIKALQLGLDGAHTIKHPLSAAAKSRAFRASSANLPSKVSVASLATIDKTPVEMKTHEPISIKIPTETAEKLPKLTLSLSRTPMNSAKAPVVGAIKRQRQDEETHASAFSEVVTGSGASGIAMGKDNDQGVNALYLPIRKKSQAQ